MGRLLYDSTLKQDFPVMLGILLIFTILGILGRLLSDIAYGWVDPRISYE